MRDIAILMACWKVPELLKVSVPSILKSLSTDSELIIILNEADKESIDYLDSIGVKHIDKDINYGPSAVDFAIPYVKEQDFKYVANVNSDMLFSDGWDNIIIKIMEENKPCTVSCCLVEPDTKSEPPVRIIDSVDFFGDGNTVFNENVKNGKYETIEMIGTNHPIICTTEDFLKVNGYSDNMDKKWVEVCGNSLDPYFVFRLYKLYGENIKFIRTNKVFVYHNSSYNRKKFNVINKSGREYFKIKTNMTVNDFVKKVKINS
jgi:GT2 family glycosyltransferase